MFNSKVNSGVELFSLKELYEMRENKIIGIPAVQRRLVWEPSQIVNLWDSLVKGYPVGIFQCYIDAQNKKALIDGQQRFNAICLGFADSEEATLWVTQEVVKDAQGNPVAVTGNPIFMVCTRRHPWGYQRLEHSDGAKLTPFSASERDEKNQKLKKQDNQEENFFKIADLENGKPLTNQGDYCRLREILNSDSAPDGFEHLWNSDWAQKLRSSENKIIPLVTIPDFKPEPAQLREVFARINRGGSPLSPRDELYSAICVYGEDVDIKGKNRTLSDGFLPPERLTRLAARMAKSASGNSEWKYTDNVSTENICAWFKNDETEAQKLKDLYTSELPGSMQSMKSIFDKYIGNKEESVPAYIYLRDREDNWIYVIFSLIKKYSSVFNENTNELTEKYFPLLCMLPYVMCGTSAAQGRRNFCQGFYNEAMKACSVNDILELMSIGLIGASFNHAFTWPYPIDMKNIPVKKDGDDYTTYWMDIFRSIYGRVDNNILYYYQRRYVNKMLESGFNPALPSTWESKDNRPWDMDHVIPDSWWNNDSDSENIRNEIGNMQVMYFRDNRIKNNNYAGAYDFSNSEIYDNEKDDYIKSNFLYNQDEYRSISDKTDYESKIQKVRQRQKEIITKVYDDLHMGDLMAALSGCTYLESSVWARAAKKRFDVFNEISKVVFKEPVWGACTYDWRRQQKNVDDITWLSIDEPTYYNTLSNWLIVGEKKKIGNVEVLWSVQAAIEVNSANDFTIHYIVGFSRPIGVSTEEWRKICKAANWKKVDDWFVVEEVPSLDNKDKIDIDMKIAVSVEDHRETIKTLLYSCKAPAKNLECKEDK